MPYRNHILSAQSLITPYEKTRSGFISLALEKNRKITPFVEEAKALKVIAERANTPTDLLNIGEIHESLLTASGISDKARKHLRNIDQFEAINRFIENYLNQAGESFIEELVYRFLLTRGDSLGGSMRNFAGTVGEWKFSRILIATLSVFGRNYAISIP